MVTKFIELMLIVIQFGTLPLMALIISVLALIISAISLWYNHLQKANIIVKFGKFARLWFENNLPRVDVDLIFMNIGAKPGTIETDIICEVISDHQKIELEELWFSKHDEAKVSLESYAYPIVIFGKNSIVKTICFGLLNGNNTNNINYQKGKNIIYFKYSKNEFIKSYFYLSEDLYDNLEKNKTNKECPAIEVKLFKI